MPAITSALMALRLSGRLIVIQNAWSRFSCSTSADASVIGTPYVAARRSPRGGASALGTARRRSLFALLVRFDLGDDTPAGHLVADGCVHRLDRAGQRRGM